MRAEEQLTSDTIEFASSSRLDSLSGSERMWAVYANYGRALLFAHHFEGRVAALLQTRACDRSDTAIEFREEKGKIDRLPLGPLIERFIQEFRPDDQFTRTLRVLVSVRNELAHRMVPRILAAARKKARWEERVVMELDEIASCFRTAYAGLQSFADEWYSRQGLSEEQLVAQELQMYPGIVERLTAACPQPSSK